MKESIHNVFFGHVDLTIKEGANKQVISSQADSLIKISRIWADFFSRKHIESAYLGYFFVSVKSLPPVIPVPGSLA